MGIGMQIICGLGRVYWVHTSFFLQFQLAHQNVNIGQRAFEVLKPYFVKPCKDRNVCYCNYHVELDMLKQGLNNMRGIQKGGQNL